MSPVSIIGSKEVFAAQRWDAEAYDPELRRLERALRGSPFIGDRISHPTEIPREYTLDCDGVPFLLASNLRPILPDLASVPHVSASVASKLAANRLAANDVLVTRTGANHGVACVFLEESSPYLTSGEGLIVRCGDDIDAAYLGAYLGSRYGLQLCRKAGYGSGQPHVGQFYLAQTPILRLGPLERKVGDLVRESWSLLQKAKPLYDEAEGELLERLEWPIVAKRRAELSYVRRYSTLVAADRFDPEHFQPHYDRLDRHLRERGACELSEIVAKVSRGVQPVYDPAGDVEVINSRHLQAMHVDFRNLERTSLRYYQRRDVKKARVRIGDVLMYSTGAYVGRTNVWLGGETVLASNHVTIIRPNVHACDPVYLSLFLNSIAGLMQAEKYASGSAQRELYPSAISRFVVYLPRQRDGNTDIAWQRRLSQGVRSAYEALVDASTRLERARKLVESAIEKRLNDLGTRNGND